MAKKKNGEAAEPEVQETPAPAPPPQTPEDLDNYHNWARKHHGQPEE